jgi:hypothetical protein
MMNNQDWKAKGKESQRFSKNKGRIIHGDKWYTLSSKRNPSLEEI